MFNVTTDSFFADDLYQGFILAPAGEWVTVELPWSQLLLTGAGYVKAVQRALVPATVLSVGLSLADGRDGPFALELAWVKAVRTLARAPRTDWDGFHDNAHVLGRAQIQSAGRVPKLPTEAAAEEEGEGEMEAKAAEEETGDNDVAVVGQDGAGQASSSSTQTQQEEEEEKEEEAKR